MKIGIIGAGRIGGNVVRLLAAAGYEVLLSVPWRLVPDVLTQAGSLEGRIAIDTTNQFGIGGVEQIPRGRQPVERRVVLFLCGDDEAAKATVSDLITDAGFAPVDIGRLADVAPMEPPRREGAL
jgi:predicted dinucleotide-binding enzyme